MTHCSGQADGYQSQFWPALNGALDDSAAVAVLLLQLASGRSERENVLLDVIGAYDWFVGQGMPDERVRVRLGLRRGRDDLVRELDRETARRLLLEIK